MKRLLKNITRVMAYLPPLVEQSTALVGELVRILKEYDPENLDQELEIPRPPKPTIQEEPSTVAKSEKLLTSKDVQRIFGIGNTTYYRWVYQKYLVPTLMGRKHFYREDDIYALLKKRKLRQRGKVVPKPKLR